MLKMFPNTIFIGHAQAWWANISGDEPSKDSYPKGKVLPGGFTDRVLTEYPNIYGGLSAGSGLNALTRDKDFSKVFVNRHRKKLLWSTDCPCKDGTDSGCFASRSLPVLKELAADEGTSQDIVYNKAARILKL